MPGCRREIHQRGRPLKPNSRRPITRSRSWWWRHASSVSPCNANLACAALHTIRADRSIGRKLKTQKPAFNISADFAMIQEKTSPLQLGNHELNEIIEGAREI